jgi:hypothetical protein
VFYSLAAIPTSLYVRSRQLPVRSSFYCLLPHISLLGGSRPINGRACPSFVGSVTFVTLPRLLTERYQ